MDEPFVGIEQAAKFLNVKKSWLYEQARLKRVPSHKILGLRRFRISELEAWAIGEQGDQQENH